MFLGLVGCSEEPIGLIKVEISRWVRTVRSSWQLESKRGTVSLICRMSWCVPWCADPPVRLPSKTFFNMSRECLNLNVAAVWSAPQVATWCNLCWYLFLKASRQHRWPSVDLCLFLSISRNGKRRLHTFAVNFGSVAVCDLQCYSRKRCKSIFWRGTDMGQWALFLMSFRKKSWMRPSKTRRAHSKCE